MTEFTKEEIAKVDRIIIMWDEKWEDWHLRLRLDDQFRIKMEPMIEKIDKTLDLILICLRGSELGDTKKGLVRRVEMIELWLKIFFSLGSAFVFTFVTGIAQHFMDWIKKILAIEG
jgi:hypothetical protein